MNHLFTRRTLALALAALQLVAPFAADAATSHQYRRGVAGLQVSTTAGDTGSGTTPTATTATPAQATWEVETLDFAGVPVNTTLTKTAKLANTGGTVANWSTLSTLPAGVTADASECAAVASGTYCVVSFTYAPTSTAAYSASGVAPVSGAHSNVLAITGQGLLTQAGLSAGSLALADTAAGMTSPAKSVQLVNLGNTGVSLGELATTGPFAATTDCGAVLAVGASCQVSVTFSPLSAGAATGQVSFSTAAGQQTVSLSGVGLAAEPTDPSSAGVTAYLRFEGSNGGSSFVDSSAAAPAVAVYQGVTTSTANAKVGAASGLFVGNGYLHYAASANHDITTGNATVEAWVHPTANAHRNMIAVQRPSSGTSGWNFSLEASGALQFWMTGGSAAQSTVTVPLNAWSHVAAVRSGTTLTFFVNGAAAGSATVANGTSAASTSLRVGSDEIGTSQFTGYIDDFRLTKGVARYSSSFLPTTNGDPYSASDILLVTAESGTNTAPANLAPSGVTLGVGTGSPTLSTADKRFGSKSMYLAGSTYATPAAAVNFGAADLTVEGWFKPTSAITGSTYAGFFGTGTAGGLTVYIGSGALRYASQNSSSVILVPAATTASLLTANVWHHVALTRTASDKTIRVFIDGALAGSLVLGTNPTFAAQNLVIGGDTATAGLFNGYVDDVRVSAGVARYQVPFTVPSQELSASLNNVTYSAGTTASPVFIRTGAGTAGTYLGQQAGTSLTQAITAGVIGGASVASGTPVNATVIARQSATATTATYLIGASEGGYTKMVQCVLSLNGTAVYAQASAARYTSTALTTGAGTNIATLWAAGTTQSVATSSGATGYGIAGLVVKSY